MYSVIDNNGFIIDFCVNENYECSNEQQKVKQYLGFNTDKFVKPRWNGRTWEEGATEEEIQAYKEENKTVKEPTEQEKINSQLLQANAQQQLVNASLLKQIAELQKGGN